MFSSIHPIHKRTHLILGIAAVIFGLLLTFYLVLASSPFDITFPIAELGGCADQSSCRAYCEQPQNFKACTEFAAKHGLVVKSEASRIEQRVDKFVEIIQSGGGPGGCKSESECRTYCEDPGHIDSCLEFAEEHDLIPSDELKEARKVAKAFREGKRLPGDCRNKTACEAYCSAPNHFEECVAFAEGAGFIGKEELGRFKKAAELMAKGEAPGGCTSRETCEAYCSDSAHQEECFAFAQKAGLIGSGEAEKFRRILQEGGPGGCRTRDACEAFCNNPANQEACFKFAQERGLIKGEEVKYAKESISHFRIGLEQAPPEVAECLKANLGTNIIEDIKAGKLTPGPDIGLRTRACFETHVGRPVPPQEAFQNMPPEVLSCLKSALGSEFEKFRTGQLIPTPELGQGMRACFERFRPAPPPAGDILRNAPPDVQVCLKQALGDAFERISSGQAEPNFEIKEKMHSCFEGFIPKPPEGVRPTPGTFEGPGGCRTPEECQNYCAMHKEECTNFRSGIQPQPIKPAICPAMPTVDSCPAGQEKFVAFSSPECGTYYSCRFVQNQGQICIQVITPAYDPATGVCKQFPTPCDVPVNWIKGCPSTQTYPSLEQQFQQYQYPSTYPSP